MSEYRTLTDHANIKKYIQPIMHSLGSEIPAEGQGVVFAQFDDAGEVQAFQILQNGVFAEGLWSKGPTSNLRKIWHMMKRYLETQCDMKGRQLFVIASTPAIGAACEAMGCEKMDWVMYRRKF